MKVNGLEISKPELRKRNIVKYKGIPPSWDRVLRTMIKADMDHSYALFELAHGIAKDTIANFKHGRRGLPPHYWHIFYGDAKDVQPKSINQVVKEKRSANIPAQNKNKVNVLKQQL